MYRNNVVGTLKIHLFPSHIGRVLMLSGAVSPDVLRFASLQITLTVLEVQLTSNLLFFLNPSSIAKMQP